VVLFLGVFYHMHDPVLILKKIEELTRDLLIIETHQDLQDFNRPAMAFFPRDTLQGDSTNWWGPNPECMTELLLCNACANFYCNIHAEHYEHSHNKRDGLHVRTWCPTSAVPNSVFINGELRRYKKFTFSI
jgi:hypothetical protein